ncbi:MAG TPA: helix-turn-helix domain-containing protein [Bryobacteraceae bacterium]|nr:helix-turn-helix domain-containing protein [Bryobacteraceae bacterium]
MPSTPHRLTAPDRRKQLIEAAMDLFSRKGFAGTTTKEIALAAGVSEAIIFRHFATKRDLYTAIIEHNIHSAGAKQVLAEIEACMKRRDDEGLFRLIAKEVIEEHRRDARFERLMLHASLEGHELATIYRREFGLPIFATLRAYLDRRQRSGALRHIDSAAMIVAIAGMANYYALNAGNANPGGPELKDEQVVEAFTRIMMDGIRGRKKEKKKSK